MRVESTVTGFLTGRNKMATSKIGRIEALKQRLRKVNEDIAKNPSGKQAKRKRRQLSSEIVDEVKSRTYTLDDFLEK
jgi:hypothetical protein